MLAKVLVTLGILIYALVVPIQDANSTHVFNPEWVAHARLHEVWQLSTNFLIGVFGLWLTWFRNDVRTAAVLALLVTGGFHFAYLIRGIYGGSMAHSDGTEAMILGVNLGVVVFGLIVVLSVLAIVFDSRDRPVPLHAGARSA
ncbi:MAG: hypothetical protein ACREMA_11845 [Longimicrobiales bacterium]